MSETTATKTPTLTKPTKPTKSSTTDSKTIKKSVRATTRPTKTPSVTKVIVRYDVGFKNSLFIRGSGANLSWEKGVKLKNLGPDQWVWETRSKSANCEFKILINDEIFEENENHFVKLGNSCEITPQFIWPS